MQALQASLYLRPYYCNFVATFWFGSPYIMVDDVGQNYSHKNIPVMQMLY